MREWQQPMARVLVPVSVTVALLATALPAAVEVDPAAVSARTRQQAVKSASVEFKVRDVIAKGGWLFSDPAKPIPPEETIFESNNRLIFDGSKYRIENNHFVLLWGNSKVIRVPLWTVSDGKVAKVLWPEGLPNSGPWGNISNPEDILDLKMPDLSPICMCFRWQDKTFVSNVCEEYQPTGRSMVIDGVNCREYMVRPSERMTAKYWLDPSKDYLVRRYILEGKGRPTDQWDISYRKHESGIWVLDAWTHLQFSVDGKVGRTWRAEVTSLRLNEAQPSKLFDLDFPVGSSFYDQRNRRELPAFHVEPDGSLRRLTPAEMKPPSAPKFRPWSQRNQWWFGGVWGALGLGLAVFVALRLRARRASRKLG